LSMPTHNRLRLNYDQRFSPTFPDTRQRNPKQPVCISEQWTLLMSFAHRELLAEYEILQG